MLQFKDLELGDYVEEINSLGYRIRSFVKYPVKCENDIWYLTTIADTNEFLEYRQFKDGSIVNHRNVDIEMKFLNSFNTPNKKL